MTALLNIALLLVSMSLSAACLWLASHGSWEYAVLAIWFFAQVNNMPFALMHEAVHGIAADSRSANAAIGIVAGWAFPTAFSLQRIAHLGHHRRNRTDAELYDYYLPDESRIVRNVWLYGGNLLGLYWWCVVFSNVLYALTPWIYRSRLFVERIGPALGFGPYLAELAQVPALRVWIEINLAIAYQLALFWALDLSLAGVILCNVAFALHWSVLQYADHAWSARDVRNGAWNLKVLPPSRWLALNYHYHRAHHQHPQVPWYRLPDWIGGQERQPSFWRVYFSLWKGVRPAPPMGAAADSGFLFPESEPAQQKPQQ